MLMLLLICGRALLPPLSPLIRRCCQLLPAALVISSPNQPLLVAVELRLSYLLPLLDVDCCVVGNKSCIQTSPQQVICGDINIPWSGLLAMNWLNWPPNLLPQRFPTKSAGTERKKRQKHKKMMGLNGNWPKKKWRRFFGCQHLPAKTNFFPFRFISLILCVISLGCQTTG